MKILLVNKFHYLKGGSERYYFELANLLSEQGHEVAFFSTLSNKNIKTKKIEYIVKSVDTSSNVKSKFIDIIYSKKNRSEIKKAISEFKPDIIHLNNFHRQLSSSIIFEAKKHNIPLIYTAHDFVTVCPASAMLRNDKICELCKNDKYFNCIKKKCIKKSALKSIAAFFEIKFYKLFNVYNMIDVIISPSKFVKNKLLEFGIKTNKIEVVPNFVSDSFSKNLPKIKSEKDFFYYGRLSKEKGIVNLIEAFIKSNVEEKLYIAGSGPEEDNIKKMIYSKSLKEKIVLLGFLTQEEIKKYINNVKAVIVPSIWYENCPYTILETLSLGKPVLASNIGGIPELIVQEHNGLLYDYNNINKLKDAIILTSKDKNLRETISVNNINDFNNKYSSDIYYKKIIEIYKSAIAKANLK